MSLLSSQNLRLFGFYLFLIAFACLPIWSVERFINQDGSPHVYNAYIMLELLRGNPSFAQICALNSVPLPNSTGHWLLAGLLIFFTAATATKLIVTLTFAGFVAAVGWLRYQTAGRQDLKTSLLLGTALAFNWMWFLGFYNFVIGVIGFTFTLGLFWRWRENLNFRRSLVLSLLLVIVFLSHLISFGMLVGGLLLSGVFVSRANLKRTLAWTGAAILPVLPLIVAYKLFSETSGGGMAPVWESISNPFSLSDWIMQLQGADPFLLLSRKTLPFLTVNSPVFALFSPVLWLLAALFCLSTATFTRRKNDIFSGRLLPFVLMVAFSIPFWMVAPDDFGKAHGGFLRERVLLCGLVCFVPLFRTKFSPHFKRLAQVFLIFIIIFQTAVIWEYALWANELGREYFAAEQAIKDTDSLGSVVLIENGCRFRSNPLTNMNTLLGVGKNTLVWDNYEIGYYLFPVVARNSLERQFAFDFRESNAINLCNPSEVDEKLTKLRALLNRQHDKIKVMLVWNGDERVSDILHEWYEEKPFFQSGRVALFRHR